jgi:hypothetical protein
MVLRELCGMAKRVASTKYLISVVGPRELESLTSTVSR